MSLLYDASLIITPNAYKESKLYSLKPQSGAGDMTVTRATTATRVNSQGLIEETPYNLLRYSEDCSNSVWTKSNSTIVSTNNLAPNGTNTAVRISMLPGGATAQLFNTFPSFAGTYTVSVWVRLVSGTGDFNLGFYDFSTVATSPITVTSSWQLFTVTKTIVANAMTRGCWLYSNSVNNIIEVWGAQLVQGSTPKPYFPTTDRLNVPRLTYQNGGGGCPSLLLEPQRTNVALYSQQFDNAGWTKTNASITADSTISPDGTQNADKLFANIATIVNPAEALQATSQTANTTYSYSVYAKKSTSNFIALRLTSVAGNPYAWFNLNTGTIGTVQTGLTASIINVGNGYYRCTVVGTTPAVIAVNRVDIIVSDNDANYVCALNGSIFIWGAQLEAGAYPTSYIPTIASTVTRNADVISKTGISSLIGQTEGTLFLEIQALYDDAKYSLFSIFASDLNRIAIGYNNNLNNLYFEYRVNSQYLINTNVPGPIVKTNNNKIIVKYKIGEQSVFINGVKINLGSFTNTFTETLNNFNFSYDSSNSLAYYGRCKGVQLYKTALTDSECISLTTI
jgi:hypothetical protein